MSYLIITGVLLLMLWLGLRTVEYLLIFKGRKTYDMQVEDLGLEVKEVYIPTKGNKRLHGYWFPCQNANGTMIMFHGNYGNVSQRFWVVEFYQDMGLNTLLFDYRGYGKSPGLCSEKKSCEDALAAYDWVVKTRQEKPERLLLHGRSMGGATSLFVANHRSAAGILIENTFTDMWDMTRQVYPFLPRGITKTRFDNRSLIPNIQMPLMMAHSPEDELIPYAMSEELYSLAQEPKRFFTLTGSHNDAGWKTTPGYLDACKDFVKTCLTD